VFVSPADFQAYAEATGTPPPTSAKERAALTPQVIAWKEAQQRTQVVNRDDGSLAPLLVGGGLLAAGAGGLALYQQLRQRGVEPRVAADVATAAEAAVAATGAGAGGGGVATAAAPAAAAAATPGATAEQQASLRSLYAQMAGTREVEGTGADSGLRNWQRPAARLIRKDEKSTLEGYPKTGGIQSHDAGAYAYGGRGYQSKAMAPALEALGRGDQDGFVKVVGDVIATLPQREINVFLDDLKAAGSRWGGDIKPAAVAAGKSEEDIYGAVNSKDASGLSRTKSNAGSQTDFVSRDEKPQFGATQRSVKEPGATLATEIDGSYSTNPLGDIHKAAVGERPDGSTIENVEAIIEDVRRNNPQGPNEKNKNYGERIMKLVRSIPNAYIEPLEVSSQADEKLAETFYLDSDGTYQVFKGGKRIVDKEGKVIYSGRKQDGQPIASSDIAFFPTKDSAFYGAPVDRFGKLEGIREGRVMPITPDPGLDAETAAKLAAELPRPAFQTMQMHPFMTRDEVIANAQEAEMARPVFFDQEDQLIKDYMEPLPYSRRGEGAVKPHMTDDVGVVQWSKDPETGKMVRDDFVTWLQPGHRQKEPGGGGAVAAGQLLGIELDRTAKAIGKPVSQDFVLLRARAIAREFNTDPNSVLRAMYLGKPLSAEAGLSENHAADREMVLAERAKMDAITGWKGAPAAKRIGNPSKDDAFVNLLMAAGRHAGADMLEMEQFVRKGRVTEAANALVRVMPKMADTFKGQMGGLSAEERISVIGMAVTSGIQDLSALLQKKPELNQKFGMGEAGKFDLDAFLKGYVRNFVLLDGIAASDNPVYQVPSDSFERIALMHKRLAADPSVPVDASDAGLMKTLEMVTARAGSTSKAVLTLDQLTSTAASEREIDPNATATKLAESLFTSDDEDLQDLNARKAARAVDNSSVNLNFATRRDFDVSKGFLPNPRGRQLDASVIDERVEAYTQDVGAAAYDENSFLKAQLKSLDSKAPNYQQLAGAIKADQAYVDANANRFERAKALLNTGRRPDDPSLSQGDNLLIEPGGRLGFGSSRYNLSYDPTSNENVDGPVLSDDRLEDINRGSVSFELSTEDLADEVTSTGLDRAMANRISRDLYTSPTNIAATGRPMVEIPQGEVAEPLDYKNIGPTAKRQIDQGLQQRVVNYNADRPNRVAAALEQLPPSQPFEMPRQAQPQLDTVEERRALLDQQARDYKAEFGGGGGGELGQPKLFSLLGEDGSPLKGQSFWEALRESDALAEPGRQQRSEERKANLQMELADLESELSGGFENRYNVPGLRQNTLAQPANLAGGGRIDNFVLAKESDPQLWEESVSKRIGEIRSQLYPRPQGDPDAAVVRTPRAPEATPMAANSGEDFARRQVEFLAARQGIEDQDTRFVTELPNVGNPPTQPLTTPGAARQAAAPPALTPEQEDMAWRRALAARISAVASGVDGKGQPKAAFGPLGIEGRRRGHELGEWQEPSPQMLQLLARRFNL
jgi:hypothetical protein